MHCTNNNKVVTKSSVAIAYRFCFPYVNSFHWIASLVQSLVQNETL